MYIGIDIGGTNIRAGLINKGKLIKVIKEKTKSNVEKKEILKQIIGIIFRLYSPKVKGIGIGIPSIIKNGKIIETPHISGLKNFDLRKAIKKEYNVPVFLENDANCFAIGFSKSPLGKKYKNIVAITIGTSIGAGIIIDNKIYRGINGGAGEIAHIPFRRKQMENYCSELFFETKYKIKAIELEKLAKKNNEEAILAFDEFGHNLGDALSIIIGTYAPEVIIIGGSISKAKKYFKESMLNSVLDFKHKSIVNKTKILFIKNYNTSLIGAANLCLK